MLFIMYFLWREVKGIPRFPYIGEGFPEVSGDPSLCVLMSGALKAMWELCGERLLAGVTGR